VLGIKDYYLKSPMLSINIDGIVQPRIVGSFNT